MISEIAQQIGARVRSARADAGLSQLEVATALDLSQAAVSQIEAGRRSPRVDELSVLSGLLARDVDYFLSPMREQPQMLGMTFRAATAELPLPDLRDALGKFIDEVEAQPAPGAELSIRATEPVAAARETLEMSGQDTVPVDIKRIAAKLGVSLFFRPFPDALSAFLLRGDDRSVIGVNSNQAPFRQRFSAAHECGHFVLRHADDSVFDYAVLATSDGEPPGYHPQNEREANTFAAELLMPADQLGEEAASMSHARLAKRYKVSQEAMSFRLLNLGLRNA